VENISDKKLFSSRDRMHFTVIVKLVASQYARYAYGSFRGLEMHFLGVKVCSYNSISNTKFCFLSFHLFVLPATFRKIFKSSYFDLERSTHSLHGRPLFENVTL